MWDILETVQQGSGAPDNTALVSAQSLLAIGANVLVGITFLFSLGSIGYAGLLYITSAGDPKKAQIAWQAFLWGMIAGLLCLSLLVIRNVFIASLDIDPMIGPIDGGY